MSQFKVGDYIDWDGIIFEVKSKNNQQYQLRILIVLGNSNIFPVGYMGYWDISLVDRLAILVTNIDTYKILYI